MLGEEGRGLRVGKRCWEKKGGGGRDEEMCREFVTEDLVG